MFDKILIANRGEIACRIIQTARKLGIKTVAVYSDADVGARHTHLADECVHIGGPLSKDSYLNIDIIVRAAKTSGAQAIHPGYGFLSENADFAAGCAKSGLIFIGPSPKAIAKMGLKDEAKRIMEQAGVPVVPGYHGDIQSADHLAQQAETIGYPVMIKARAGGGGKGMRIAQNEAEFAQALSSAQNEGRASFGDPHVLIEKLIPTPRHIEVQIFGDRHGNIVHLYERDCSLQRRHQKVIEEAPAPDMPDDVREAMTTAAIKAAKEIGYEGAGTVEFIADGSGPLRRDGFWFMEMNTRLQVEHPVTEAITGLDLVEWQLRVAAGQPLPLRQDDIPCQGHAIEARIYAEDPTQNFKPSAGRLQLAKFGDTCRADIGFETGDTIPPYYDPMIGKLIAHGVTRAEAVQKLTLGLQESVCIGPKTNLSFLGRILAHQEFQAADLDTGFLDRAAAELTQQPAPDAFVYLAAYLVAHGIDLSSYTGWRHWGTAAERFAVKVGEEEVCVDIIHTRSTIAVTLGGQTTEFQSIQRNKTSVRALKGNVWQTAQAYCVAGQIGVQCGIDFHLLHPLDPLNRTCADTPEGPNLTAPMTGLVTDVCVSQGSSVSKGDPLVRLEAMKMEYVLKAPFDGDVVAVNCKSGSTCQEGEILVTLKERSA